MFFENVSVPLSLFNKDGTFVMTDKSQFLHKMEALIPREQITDLNKCDTVIIDGNAAIYML